MASEEARSRWEHAYRDYFPRVYRALLAVLRNKELACDALHDAFLEGVRRPPATDENIPGWLYRVALRRSRRGPYRTPLASIGELLFPAPRDEIAEALDRTEVTRLLGMLSERQRAMVIAQHYLGLEQEELRVSNAPRPAVGETARVASRRARPRAGPPR